MSYAAVMTKEQVIEARRRFKGGDKLSHIARDLELSRETLKRAVYGVTYRWVTEEEPAAAVSARPSGHAHYRAERVQMMRRLGMSPHVIAEITGYGLRSVYRLLRVDLTVKSVTFTPQSVTPRVRTITYCSHCGGRCFPDEYAGEVELVCINCARREPVVKREPLALPGRLGR